jgi:HK97 family phage major capsid protein
MRTIDEIEAREAEIKQLITDSTNEEEVRALSAEIDDLQAEREELRKAAEAAAEEKRKAAESGETIRKEITMNEERTFTAASEEYRSAWLKNLAVVEGRRMFGDLTEVEERAYTHLTSNSSAVVPTAVMNRIVELVPSFAPMYADASKSAMTQGFGVPRHTAIAAGDAAPTDEGAAPTYEQDSFDLLSISGVEIKKVVKYSRKMKWQSIAAFEDWVVTHIAKRIAVAKELQIIARLGSTSTGIASGNVITGTSGSPVNYTDVQIRDILAKIKENGPIVWYANQKTIYTQLTAIKDLNGRPLFLDNTVSDDPLVKGRIYGGLVKQDENLSDNVVYVGVPSSILANDFEDLFIFSAIEPGTVQTIVTGYSLFDAGLENPLAFVKVTFYPGE